MVRFTLPFIPAAPQAGFPLRYNKPQGILAKANKKGTKAI
jgi:hypothetical protein